MSLLSSDVWQAKIRLAGWVDGAGGTRTVVQPATGDALGEIGLAAPADVAEAVRIGRAAQRDWARAPYTERAAVLRRAGALWKEHASEIHEWLIREAGSIPGKAVFETTTAAPGARHGGPQANIEAFTDTQWVTIRDTPPHYPL